MLLVELFTFPEAMEFVLSDGIANAPQGDDGTNTGTYTVDGTVITIIDDEDSEIITLTINADGTLTMDNSNSGGCFDDEGNEVEGASDDTCSGNWAQPSCFAMIFNLVAS